MKQDRVPWGADVRAEAAGSRGLLVTSSLCGAVEFVFILRLLVSRGRILNKEVTWRTFRKTFCHLSRERIRGSWVETRGEAGRNVHR